VNTSAALSSKRPERVSRATGPLVRHGTASVAGSKVTDRPRTTVHHFNHLPTALIHTPHNTDTIHVNVQQLPSFLTRVSPVYGHIYQLTSIMIQRLSIAHCTTRPLHCSSAGVWTCQLNAFFVRLLFCSNFLLSSWSNQQRRCCGGSHLNPSWPLASPTLATC